MTNAELVAEARKLDAEATKGPWTYSQEAANEYWFGNGYFQINPCNIPVGGFDQWGKPLPIATGNAAFIARARTLLPQLAEALEKAARSAAGWEETALLYCKNGEAERERTRKLADLLRRYNERVLAYSGVVGGVVASRGYLNSALAELPHPEIGAEVTTALADTEVKDA